MSSTPKKYMTGLSHEEKVKRRQEQLRQAQLKYREKHGLIKPKLTEEEKEQRRKEKAHERYLKNREAKKGVEELPMSYTVDYRRNYHKQYYEQHKEVLLNRSKERYTQKAIKSFPVVETPPMTIHSDN
jgi:hypothetical protein